MSDKQIEVATSPYDTLTHRIRAASSHSLPEGPARAFYLQTSVTKIRLLYCESWHPSTWWLNQQLCAWINKRMLVNIRVRVNETVECNITDMTQPSEPTDQITRAQHHMSTCIRFSAINWQFVAVIASRVRVSHCMIISHPYVNANLTSAMTIRNVTWNHCCPSPWCVHCWNFSEP